MQFTSLYAVYTALLRSPFEGPAVALEAIDEGKALRNNKTLKLEAGGDVLEVHTPFEVKLRQRIVGHKKDVR